MEATAIIEGTAKLEAAQTLADWSVTEEANEMYNDGYAVVAIPASPSRSSTCPRTSPRR